MNRRNTARPSGIVKIAKFAVFKLMLLSTASLLAPSAFAMSSGYDNFSECLDINTNISRYVSSYGYFNEQDYVDFNNEWTLSANLPGYHIPAYPNLPKDQNGLTKFKLVGIKITTKPYNLKVGDRDNVAFPIVKTIACEYQDPTGVVPGSLVLNLKENGKIYISTADAKIAEKDTDGNPINDRTISYVSRGGQVLSQKKWKTDRNATTVTEFACSEKDSSAADWLVHCGGWNMNRKIQNNGFWSDAFFKCRRDWPRCNFTTQPFVYWSYAIDLNFKHHQIKYDYNKYFCGSTQAIVDGWPKGAAYNCRVLNTAKAYCKEPKCEAEITAINNIIGEYKDGSGKSGMADYLTAKHVCWGPLNKKVAWQGKKWEKRFETCTDMSQPTENWPSYSHLSSN